MTVYIAGPVTGRKNLNKKAFLKAALSLVDFHCIIPHYIVKDEQCWYRAMELCIPYVVKADALLLLEGWRESRGASLEKVLARSLDIPCFENIYDLREYFSKGAHHGH